MNNSTVAEEQAPAIAQPPKVGSAVTRLANAIDNDLFVVQVIGGRRHEYVATGRRVTSVQAASCIKQLQCTSRRHRARPEELAGACQTHLICLVTIG